MLKKKTQPQELIEEIATDLIIYLKDGQLAPNSFIEKINLNISNFQQLLRIHFILQDEVREFIEKLPYRLRNIKTSTRIITEIIRGKVQGSIDWEKTIKRRCKTNNLQENIFACQQMDRNFNIKENLVLKRLLEIIHKITIEELETEKKDYSWLADWLGNKQLAEQLKTTYLRNIYLKRIHHEQIEVTSRMINDTKQSRNLLYQEAAELLDYYRRLTNINCWTSKDQAEIKEMLSNTFIKPQNDAVLFELYWIIKLLNFNSDKAKLSLVDGSNNLVASWEQEDKTYYIYHDSEGSGRLKWRVTLDELIGSDNSYLQRRVSSRKTGRKLADDLFDEGISGDYWSGRPDIVVEVINNKTDQLEKIIIGEVKYTNKVSTTKQGLKELLDYLFLIKDQDGYLDNNSKLEIEGLLLLDKISSLDGKVKGIKIFQQQNNWLTESYSKRDIEL